jgi:hypothetical protein
MILVRFSRRSSVLEIGLTFSVATDEESSAADNNIQVKREGAHDYF